MAAFLRRIALAAVLGFATVSAAAPPLLSVAVDTAAVRLGDPVRLQVRVERDPGQQTLFPEAEAAFSPWTLRARSAVGTAAGADGRLVDTRIYELAAFRLDVDQMPAVEVRVVAGGDTTALRAEPVPVQMVSVRDPGDGEQLRDIKPPVWIPGGIPLWLALLLLAALLFAVAWLVSRWLRRREQTASAAPAPRPAAPVDYEREFARIADMGLLERGALKLYYTHLSEVMRRFLEDRLAVDALERTTTQIEADLLYLPGPAPDADTRRRILAFLQAADLVKFARAEPAREEAAAAPEEGGQIVVTVLDQLRAAAAPPEAPHAPATAGAPVSEPAAL